MSKVVDIYIPLDGREAANRAVWPVASRQLKELIKVIAKCGWQAHVLNPARPVASVAEGLKTIKKARGERFIDFMAGWAYPDFYGQPDVAASGRASPSFCWAAPSRIFRATSACSRRPRERPTSGIATDRLFVERFENHDEYADAVDAFLNKGALSTFPAEGGRGRGRPGEPGEGRQGQGPS